MRLGRKLKHKTAFTLVELLVVIGIIALLISILLPSLNKAREQANKTNCLANLRTIGQGMRMYANDFRDRLPNSNPIGISSQGAAYNEINYVMVEFFKQDARAAGTFHCPSDADDRQHDITNADFVLPNSARCSYDFYSPYWAPEYGPILTRIKDAPLAWDLDVNPTMTVNPNQNHGVKGGNVVYADGHADWQDAKDWDAPDWPHPAASRYHY
ncbi:MAG: DUF1559 domain-containing protein [Planctomycetes bacterium]|nr:DUF1559 domain-containing protein [Planctomycetota bacterium]